MRERERRLKESVRRERRKSEWEEKERRERAVECVKECDTVRRVREREKSRGKDKGRWIVREGEKSDQATRG